MKEIKLTIDGKEVQLTEKQLKALGIGIEKRENPFERAHPAGGYFYIDEHGRVKRHYDTRLPYEEETYKNVNYFTDEAFARQVALHQLLYRKLLKFAYDNECADNQIWGGNGIEHWYIVYDFEECIFYAEWASGSKNNDVYFSTKDGAERAIEEVVEPFVKEHPEFVW